MREIPDEYPQRVFLSKEEGWVTVPVPVDSRVRELWEEPGGIGERWSQFWEVSSRWPPLYNKFLTTGDEKVSAELRQVEMLLLKLEDRAASSAGSAGVAESPVVHDDDLAAKRAMKERMAGGG